MAEKKDEQSEKALKSYVKPVLIVHGALSFIATQSAEATPAAP